APFHTVASRDVEQVKIYGQSGDEVIDNQSYNNVPFTVKIAFITYKTAQTANDIAQAVINWLAPLQGAYYTYTDSWNPGYFTKARLTNFDEVKRELRTLLTATLKFSRVPYWYKNSGTAGVTFSDQGLFVNPEIYPSEPVLNLTYTGSGTITVRITFNGAPIEITMDSSYINNQILDGVRKQHYRVENGSKVYLSSVVPPDLMPGDNIIAFDTSQVTCTLIPNWRRL
ncbi:MAG: hypothetical protein IIV23_10200, partial [Ruminococcus sp.]|nr:hypothetical protein [Ruminococcus sp.]